MGYVTSDPPEGQAGRIPKPVLSVFWFSWKVLFRAQPLTCPTPSLPGKAVGLCSGRPRGSPVGLAGFIFPPLRMLFTLPFTLKTSNAFFFFFKSAFTQFPYWSDHGHQDPVVSPAGLVDSVRV